MASHNLLGKKGEEAARDFLVAQGMIVREQNWRMNRLEIDLVAEEPSRNMLHIVEVKTRTSDAHFDPMKAVTRKKQLNLVNAANGYVHYYQLKMYVQFDVMIIVGTPENFKIQYIPKAFQPPLRTYR